MEQVAVKKVAMQQCNLILAVSLNYSMLNYCQFLRRQDQFDHSIIARMEQALYACIPTLQLNTFFGGFCLQVFREAGPPKRVDCLASIGNKV